MLMTDVGLTGADPLDITQSGHEPGLFALQLDQPSFLEAA